MDRETRVSKADGSQSTDLNGTRSWLPSATRASVRAVLSSASVPQVGKC